MTIELNQHPQHSKLVTADLPIVSYLQNIETDLNEQLTIEY